MALTSHSASRGGVAGCQGGILADQWEAGAVLVHPWDAAVDDPEWQAFVAAHPIGHLIAPGRDRDLPVVVPTPYLFEAASATDVSSETGRGTVLLHLARPNPVWEAIDERPLALLVVTGDWAYVPGAWKAVGAEDPAYGIPTLYYASVQLSGPVTLLDDDEAKTDVLRRTLARFEPPNSPLVDPAAHARRLPGIRALRIDVAQVTAKFKYGGNADAEHRESVSARLAERAGPADAPVRTHTLRRLARE